MPKAKKKTDSKKKTSKKIKLPDKIEGFCMRCKTKRVMQNTKPHQMENGNAAAKGECPECGTGMFKILSKKERG